ncbi:MAG: GDP-mannose 4,6-dehydratase [Gammaproteobacteria bacterium]|nr:GDP-mannose 4,6-dehydratase [Gammaproteobacteria bacterium]MBU1443045.1 GDP-mannose 4,6-dehydratase [Gammaproteobacteria bacterium]MBU2285820.1 GDP-mannose 4,6-dehydratase [Gammaproteobacteria bacterium]
MQPTSKTLNGQKYLVTGAGGFIGSHLVEALVRAGADVTAMIRYGSSASWGNLEYVDEEVRGHFAVIAGNIDDGDFVRHAMQGIDVVCHLAALIAIPYSYVAPLSYVRTNVEGTLNVMEAARRLSVRRVVHTSTSEVYGTAMRVPIDETHPLQGQSPYSASKIGADKIAESYYRSFDTGVVTLRPFNTFGPRQSARAFIPTIVSQALTQETIKLGSLTPERDMTFVTDTVAGFVAASTTVGIEGQTINLGTGSTYTIGHFAERILRLMGVEKEIVPDASRMRPDKSEVLKLVSDNSLAASAMGWTPQVDLDEGLRQTIDFIRNNLNLYRPGIYNV